MKTFTFYEVPISEILSRNLQQKRIGLFSQASQKQFGYTSFEKKKIIYSKLN